MNRWLRTDSPGREGLVMLVVALAIVFLPEVMPFIGGYTALGTRVIIFALFALGFDILLGFTGFLSFGHAAFWGLGNYFVALYLLHVSGHALIAILVAVAAITVVAVVLGLITLRRHGIYFAILTLAFAEMFYFAALAPLSDITGGDNGLTGVPTAELFGRILLEGPAMHYFAAAWVVLGVYLARRIRRSPYGLILRAIRSNETRLRFTGIHVFRYKLMAFVVSGIYAGLAGTLYAIYQSYVPTHTLHWTTSGEIVMMTVIGGVGTLIGPMVGAGIVLYLENVLSAITNEWYLILGLIFMAFVIFLPGGVADGARRLVNLLSSGKRSSAASQRVGAERGDKKTAPLLGNRDEK